MGIIKKVVLVIGAFVGLLLLVAAFVPKTYSVEEEITVQKPKDQVFEYIKYLKNQDDYSKWAAMDPGMEKSFKGTDGTVGFISAWKSGNEHVGVGEQEIIGIKEGERIDYALRFFEPFESSDESYMITEHVSDQATKVKWGFKGRMDYPMNLMLLAMDFEEAIGDDFAIGLSNLKVELEK